MRVHYGRCDGKPTDKQEGFDDYRKEMRIRFQDLGEKYREDTNEYLSRFCSESILGATVLLGFISDWIIADKAPVQTGCLLRVISICAWSSILSSIFCGMLYLFVSVQFYRYYRSLYEKYCNKMKHCVSKDEIVEKYDDVFGNAPQFRGDGLLVAQGTLFAVGTIALSIALFLK